MPDIKIKKDGTDYPLQTMPLHYPADRVYLDGDTSKTVQDALDNKVSKSGDTMRGNLTVDKADGTSSAIGWSSITIGNTTSQGTEGNSAGYLRICGKNDKWADIYDENGLTANRNIILPDKSGTIALTSDLDNYSRKAVYKNEASNTVTITIPLIGSHCFLIVTPTGLTTVGTLSNGSVDTVFSTNTEHPSTNSGNDVTVWVGNYYRSAVMHY